MPLTILLLRGLWWRRGLTAAVLVVAVVTTAAAALGPLYARAAAESVLQDHLRSAGSTAGLHLSANLDLQRQSTFDAVATQTPRPGTLKGYDQVIAGVLTPEPVGVSVTAAGVGFVQSRVAWRDGACAHLVLVSGRCPTKAGEAIASERTVDSGGVYDWKLGRTLYVAAMPAAALTLRIVGVYRPIDTADAFWFGQGSTYFTARGGANGPDQVDSLFVAKDELLGAGRNIYAEADFDYPLTPSAVRLANVAGERASVGRLLASYPKSAQIVATTGLISVLDAAGHDRTLVDIATLLVTLQLALLAWLVLFQVVSDAIDARGNEIAMAKLRGHSPTFTVRFGLGEVIGLLVAAVPLGLLTALELTHLLARLVMVSGVPVVMPVAAFGASLVAFGGGAVAAVAAGWQTLTRPLLDQWRRTTRAPGHSRMIVAVDAVLAAAAVSGLMVLRANHQAGNNNDAAALLTPGLLVFAVAILGVRALPASCRWLARRTRATRHVGTFLATRQVARRPVGLRLAALLAVAVGLAIFAVAGESVASTNRTARAGAEIGAAKVAAVVFTPGLDPIAAVQRADPDGRWAMAAATWLPDGGDSVTGTVLGVDPSRLAAVANRASGAPSNSQLAADIGESAVPPITITTGAMRVHLNTSRLAGDRPPYLQVNLRTATAPFVYADGPSIRDGSNSYLVPVPCTSGCQLRGLTWDRAIDAKDTSTGTISLTGLDVRATDGTWTPLNIRLGQAGAWRAATPQGTATDQVSTSGAAIVDHFTNRDGGYGGLSYADPASIPAVAAGGLVTGPGAPTPLELIDGIANATAYFHVVEETHVLPAVLDDGVVMSLRFLTDELPGFVTEAQWQVWLGPHAPADAIARLQAAGLHVESVQSQSTRVRELGRQAPALALLLLLACAIGGTVLATGGTAISVTASSRRRAYELAALRAVRVGDGALLRAGIIEQLLLLGAAVLLGVPTGLLAARIAMPVIPEFSDNTPITLVYTPHLAPALAFAACFVALLALIAFISARALMRAALPTRLREAAE